MLYGHPDHRLGTPPKIHGSNFPPTMPYGKSYKPRYPARGNGRAPYRRGAPKKAVPVPRKRKTFKTHVRTNALAINRIARVQRQLKAMTYGSVQEGYHTLNVDSIIVHREKPILMDLGDFTRYRQVSNVQTIGARVYTLAQAQDYNVLSNPNSYDVVPEAYWKNQTFQNSPYFMGRQEDIVDTGKYLPMFGSYTFKIRAASLLAPVKVTFTMFTVRAKAMIPLPLGMQERRNLPAGLVNLRRMADPTENRMSRQFFKVYKTQTVWVNPVRPWPGDITTASVVDGTGYSPVAEKFHTITIRPKKVRTQDITNPDDPSDPTPEAPDGNYGHHQVTHDTPLWLLISCTDMETVNGGAPGQNMGVNQFVTVDCTRVVKWRDHIGAR